MLFKLVAANLLPLNFFRKYPYISCGKVTWVNVFNALFMFLFWRHCVFLVKISSYIYSILLYNMFAGHLTALPFSHSSNKFAYLLTILSRDISGLHFIFRLFAYFYFYRLKSSLSAEFLTIIGYYFNFFEELLWILFRLWALTLFLAEGFLRGVWFIVFFPVRLRPLLAEEVFSYLAGSFVGVFSCRLAVSGTFYRLMISFLVYKGFYCLSAFLTIWDFLVVSCDLIFLIGLFS